MTEHSWYVKGQLAFVACEPISNAPRVADPDAAPHWRKGWLDAKHGDIREDVAEIIAKRS